MKAKLGLGLAALGRPGYINLGHAEDLGANYNIEAMRQHAHRVLDVAWELGIRYFDAARSYGRAEEFLANWIEEQNIPSAEIQVGSKWGYTYTADWQVQTPDGVAHEVKSHELQVLQRQYEESNQLIGDQLGLYQIHSATIDSGVLENATVLGCLNEMRESGMPIGLTVSGEGQSQTIDKALEIRFDGQLLFSSVQATWNLLEKSATEALKRAHAAGLSVIIKEALANGRLTTRNNAAEFQDNRSVLEALAKEYDSTVDAISIAAVLNQDWVTTVLSGAASAEHLRSNVKAINVAWDQRIENRLAELVQSPQDYWNQRSNLAWN
jgi:aryl-alcohol dehydrogenase-like predicted oxidoreductase